MNVSSDDKQMHGHALTPLHLYKNIYIFLYIPYAVFATQIFLWSAVLVYLRFIYFFISLGPCCDQFTIGES